MARMVRKQIYLEVHQDRKLKRLAATRGRTEAEVIREAVDQLPEPRDEHPVIAKLEAAGLLAPKPPLPPELIGVDRDELEKKLFKMLAKRGRPLTLSDAVLEERRNSPY
jgi:hypothetical protein